MTNNTTALAGKTPPTGSKSWPQFPAAIIALLMSKTLEAVVAFCIKPVQALAGQFTDNVLVLRGFGPTLNRTISLNPSSLEGEVAEQASTKMDSISKHWEKP
ncbi:hypothetical protein EZL74_12700 [Flavobacterium silvisoli]|uniref:Uncharacterized protein n=1 Tax=Flavobacterium silvisoli TaxID=2529433 RepID=A0A4Q9YU53_9FLAO|nr:hypothetical protein EZL74_12700 [Flavobacterium silvisoli]